MPFVLFSSIASLFGNIGQINYSSANSSLDGLAYMRSSLGLPSLSIQWPAIAEIGMAAASKIQDNTLSLKDTKSVLEQLLKSQYSNLEISPVQSVLPNYLFAKGSLPLSIDYLVEDVRNNLLSDKQEIELVEISASVGKKFCGVHFCNV